MDVKLTWHEMLLASTIGSRRHIEALRAEKKDSFGFNGETGWQVHIEGCCGELATAKALNIYWNGSINTYKHGADVGSIQVRTRSKNDYDLIVRNNDKNEDTFILVVGQAPDYRVVGWIKGRDAKKEIYSKTYGNRPAAFFVPQAALHPIESLPDYFKWRERRADALDALEKNAIKS